MKEDHKNKQGEVNEVQPQEQTLRSQRSQIMIEQQPNKLSLRTSNLLFYSIIVLSGIFVLFVIFLVFNNQKAAEQQTTSNSLVKTQVQIINQMNGKNEFCLITFASDQKKKSIMNSIQNSDYKKFKTVDGGEWPKEQGYFDYLQIVKNECSSSDFIMFVSQQIKPNALSKMDAAISSSEATLLYSLSETRYEIIAFSRSAFEGIANAEMTEQEKQNIGSRLWTTQRSAQVSKIIQNCINKMVQMSKDLIYQNIQFYGMLWGINLNSSLDKISKDKLNNQSASK